MPSLMSSAMASIEETLRGNLGESGTLSRGSDTTTVTAVIDTVRYETVDDTTGAVTSLVSADLLIKPADYQIDSVQVEPTRGDRWHYTDGFGDTREYTVMWPDNAPVFVLEPHGHLMRVHTKET